MTQGIFRIDFVIAFIIKQLAGIFINSCSSLRGCLESNQMFLNIWIVINESDIVIYNSGICNLLVI